MGNHVSTDPSSKDATNSLDLTLITSPSRLLVWLGGSTAALTAILAAAGFLVVSTHEAMLGTTELGIPDLLHTPSAYLASGAMFFTDTLKFTAAALLWLDGWAWGAIILILVIILGSPWLSAKLSIAVKRWLLVMLGILTVIGLFILCGDGLAEPLPGKGLLLHELPEFISLADDNPVLAEMKQASVNLHETDNERENDKRNETDKGSFQSLRIRHSAFTLWVIAFGCVARLLAQLRTETRTPYAAPHVLIRFWLALRWAIFALLLLALILLPMHYGAVALDYALPEISQLSLADKTGSKPVPMATEQAPGGLTLPLLLLHDDENFLTVYNPRCRQVMRLRREDVADYVIGTFQTAFPTQLSPCTEN